MKGGGEKKMTLEEYVDYFSSGKSIDFTCSYLNQILHLHGFRKLHHSTKKTVGEAVDAVELLDLSRSTLNQTTLSSSSASLTLDQVISDIEALKWQECCITSLQIVSSDDRTRAVDNTKERSNKRKKQGNEKKKRKRNVKSIRSVNEAAAETSCSY
ncbi:unnamed protein product [Brassica oleracea var. botrytis]|uniref:DUF7787 domain-containing protein n=2 Tax=Brassica TaxID=3705 RepID=A0A3P6FMT3_BRAOL|nr:unnamed protein product [Brassica napus]CDY09979.1 BnaC08g44720D [Brassica napus]VDD59427.1 unnamed protein product [Brassica oleracea]